MNERTSRTIDVAVCVTALSWMFVACVFPLSDFDFWWHVRTGQLIVETGAVPRVDWFTYTNSDQPWIDLHWGFQVVAAWIYSLGGSAAIVCVKAALLTTAVGWGWFAGGRGLPDWARGLIWAPSLIAIYGRGFERPEAVSLVMLGVWLWVTIDLERRARWVWLLPVVQLIWVNCHSLFALGAVVGLTTAADGAVRYWADGRWGCAAPLARPSIRTWTIIAALVALAAFINPYFDRGAFFPWVVYRKFTVEQAFYAVRIGEFQRPWDFLREHGLTSMTLAAELLAMTMAVVSFVALATRRRWSPLRMLLFVAFGHLAWEAARNTNLFCLVSAVVTCANWADWRRLRADEKVRIGTTAGWAGVHRAANIGMTALFVVGLIAVVTGMWGRWTGGMKTFGWGERDGWFAHDAARFAGREGMPDHAFVAHFGQAAVYAYHLAPTRKVYMDGRLEVCSQLTFEQWEWILASIATGDRRWEATHLRQHGSLPLILLDRTDSRPFIHALRQTPGWRAVYVDATAVVFLDEKTAARLKLAAVPLDLSTDGPAGADLPRSSRGNQVK